MHLRLILDVHYDPNGTPEQELTHFLSYIARYAASAGMLTHASPAEVESWSHRVERVDAP